MLSRLFDEKKYKPLEYILRGYRENRVVNTEEKQELIKLKEHIEASGVFNKEINLILFHIDKIVYPEYVDLSDLVPDAKKSVMSAKVREYLELLDVISFKHIGLPELQLFLQLYNGVTPTPKALMVYIYLIYMVLGVDKYSGIVEIIKDPPTVDVSKYLRDIRELDNKDIDRVYDILCSYKNISKEFSFENRREEVVGLPGPHKGGGGDRLNRKSENLPYHERLKCLSERFSCCNFVIKGLGCNSSFALVYKLVRLLIHIYHSKPTGKDYFGAIPISNSFLRKNGYRVVTRLKVYYRTPDGWKVASSLHALKVLGFFDKCLPYKKKKRSRAVVLSAFSKALVSFAYLQGFRVSYRDIAPRDTQYICKGKKYEPIENEALVLDREINVDLYNSFINKMEKVNINLSRYKRKAKERIPYLQMTPEQYFKVILDKQLKGELTQEDIREFANYGRDIVLLSTGHHFDVGGITNSTVKFNWMAHVGYTGRAFQYYGAQGVTKFSKSILWEGKCNYDLSNSQLTCLYHFLNKYTDADLSYLYRYITDKSIRNNICIYLDMDKEDWKTCVYSLVFGSDINSSYTAITQVLEMYPGIDADLFYEELGKLNTFVQLWKDTLPKVVEDTKVLRGDEYFLSNGVTYLPVSSSKVKHFGKLSSFYLQGLETLFILTLIKLVKKNKVYSYEFDGLITHSPIKEEEIEKARVLTGFSEAKLEIKEFV